MWFVMWVKVSELNLQKGMNAEACQIKKPLRVEGLICEWVSKYWK
jgi:hypothetical protein